MFYCMFYFTCDRSFSVCTEVKHVACISDIASTKLIYHTRRRSQKFVLVRYKKIGGGIAL